MGEREITADDVLATAPAGRSHAERIAEYANLRAAGTNPPDARAQIGICAHTGVRYERWMRLVREHLGLPELAARKGLQWVKRDTFAAATQRSIHARYHASRGRRVAGCALCEVPDGS